ncbi:Biotin carboxylase [Actinopolyspora mzabensis]|uniref:Biotin carboxylase n=1 Tax=Actinopolyspora mzabensis TaxID=995066 RepID=A0A1G9A1Q9_ACTMZ|nr:ATP-grasp domain-containing protein [Actinopolyspora mzabensis]SDK21201.1 Biotin carboxylase [Actinopolyspora mzabensis]
MTREMVVVGCGVMAEPYLAAADELGLRIGVVETESRLEVLRESHPCVADGESVPAVLAAQDEAWMAPTHRLVGRMATDGVIAFTEPHVLATAVVQHRNGLPGPGLDAAVVSRNKALQRFEFDRAGLGQPRFRYATALNEVSDWVADNLPVVVKPLSMYGSTGVERIDDWTGWQEAVQRRGNEAELLVEECVEAPEYSWEALVREGEVLLSNLTRKETTGPPYYVETLHEVAHGEVNPALQVSADQLGREVLAVLGMRTGLCCLEFRARTSTDLVIMEVMVRMPGDHLTEVFSRAAGIDLFKTHIQLALGDEPDLRSCSYFSDSTAYRPVKQAASLFLVAEHSGRFRSECLEKLADVPGVVRNGIRMHDGAQVQAATSSADRLGYAILETSDRTELRTSIELARVKSASSVESVTDPTRDP